MIIYTRHAKNRMRWHKITRDMVEKSIASSEFKEKKNDRINAWLKIENGFIRTTYKKEDDNIVVITTVRKKAGYKI